MKKSWTENIKYEYLVCGVSAGVVSTLVLHPFDLVKVRFQVNDGTKLPNRQVYTGVLNAFGTIFKSNGMKGLYQGVTPNVIASCLHNGIYFFIYNNLKIIIQETYKEHTKLRHYFMIGCLTGGSTLVVTNPVWVVKTRMCLQPTISTTIVSEVYYKGVLDGLIKLYKYEGIRGYYRGFIPGLFGVSHGALQFMAYEELKKIASIYTGKPVEAKHGALLYLTMAALSKVFAVVTTYPYQVVRSRLQDTQMQDKYNGITDIFIKIYKHEGITGFYKGMVPSLLRVTPACCITFVVFENMSHYMLPQKDVTIT